MTAIMIYMTAPDAETAQRIAADLLQERLVACANILPPHLALYRWQGKIERAQEVAVLFKTLDRHFEVVRAAICARHPYEIPCVVSWPLGAGHNPFLRWIDSEVS